MFELDSSQSSILILGEITPVSRALQQILWDSGIQFRQIALDRRPANLLKAVADQFPVKGPNLVLATGSDAWNIGRVLNTWASDGSVFIHDAYSERGKKAEPGSSRDVAQRRSGSVRAIPLYGLLPNSIFDLLAGGFCTNGWVLRLLDAIAKAQFEEAIAADTLRLAVLHNFMASERHRLPLKVGARESHGRNDIHACLRIIQGAGLDGWITPAVGQSACAAALDHAAARGLIAAKAPRSGILDLFDALPVRSVAAPAPFASVLVVDDQGFWHSPLEPVWNQLGFESVHAQEPSAALRALECERVLPIRSVLLDMNLRGTGLAGAQLLQSMHRQSRSTPVVVLSVDDMFSETVLLRRMGAFAYLNKHAIAEPGPGRDAVAAFRQVRDAVVVSGFASLAGDFGQLWDLIELGQDRLLNTGVAGRDPQGTREDQSRLLADLAYGVRSALENAFAGECRNLFHGFWQDATHSSGLAFRQIIRAMGVVNDKWCAFWKSWQFDPDEDEALWARGVDVAFPHFMYHKITTGIRNTASHGMVNDRAFDWLDVWIMLLTLFLKLEGACRGYVSACGAADEAQEYQRRGDDLINRAVDALRGLLNVSNTVDFGVSRDASEEHIRRDLFNVAGLVEQKIRDHESGCREIPQGDPRNLCVLPYLFGYRRKGGRHAVWDPFVAWLCRRQSKEYEQYPLMGALRARFDRAHGMSVAQRRAHYLLLSLILARIPQVASQP